MPEIVVTARNRAETGKNVNRRLREQGLIPGVVYGKKKDPVPVAVSPKEIGAILRSKTGESTLFDLDLDGTRRKVILKEYQVEPVKGKLLHADFYEVALDKPIEVRVHVELVGTPVGVKTQGGVLDWLLREVEVSCLPTDIPEKISADISHLEIGKHLRVADLVAPEKVEIVTEPDVVVAHVVAPRAEEEAPKVEEVAAAAATTAEPEVIKKGKGEGEAAAPEAGAEKKAEKKEKK
ncbi:MAG TPA: 50S ribosomal protein L25/general stress protein Ctc [Vicinamibacteria bacterium]|nr:50S ribosomal protein L25/general stress protein Ctc [Vicinamibacteria bacterium]